MNETIFFVEDDTTIHSLIKATLELNGYRAVGFKDPLVFIEALKTTIPDLLILDLMLPNMSGYDVITYMKGREDYAKVPIVILSALSDELDVKGIGQRCVRLHQQAFRRVGICVTYQVELA